MHSLARSILLPLLSSVALVLSPLACSSSSDSPPDSSSGSTSGNTSGGSSSDGTSGSSSDGTSGGMTSGMMMPDPDVTLTTEQFMHAGLQRKYILAMPVDYSTAKKYPLVLVFHGNPGTAEFMRDVYPMHPVSKREAIVAYLNESPDDADQDWDLTTPFDENVDMTYSRDLAAALVAKYSIDAKKVWGFGWSGGAQFINQLACRSNFMTAIASHSGGQPLDVCASGTCKPSVCTKGPVAILAVNGELDTSESNPDTGRYEGQVWAEINGCGQQQSDATPSPCKKYNGCPATDPVVVCIVPGEGHGVWGMGIQASWDFFKSLP